MHELMHNRRLLDLAREINAREDTINTIRGQVEERLRLAGPEMILQGQALIAAKAQIQHGQWLDWLKANCPNVTLRNAERYMLRAKRADEAISLVKEYHLLCDSEELEGRTREPATQWPGDIEGINRFARAFNYFERCPLTKWPAASQKRLRELWEPWARVLWPERFR